MYFSKWKEWQEKYHTWCILSYSDRNSQFNPMVKEDLSGRDKLETSRVTVQSLKGCKRSHFRGLRGWNEVVYAKYIMQFLTLRKWGQDLHIMRAGEMAQPLKAKLTTKNIRNAPHKFRHLNTWSWLMALFWTVIGGTLPGYQWEQVLRVYSLTLRPAHSLGLILEISQLPAPNIVLATCGHVSLPRWTCIPRQP